MNKVFVFVGDPGSNASEVLTILKRENLLAKRASLNVTVQEVVSMEPLAIVLSENFENRADFICALREKPELAQVPILARVDDMTTSEMEYAYKDGVDEVCTGCNLLQFKAFVNMVTKQDSWQVVRAPAGKIVLAYQDRLSRMKLGQTLRKKGFDTYFATDEQELRKAIATQNPRAVVSDLGILGKSALSMITSSHNSEKKLFWVLSASNDAKKHLDMGKVNSSLVRLLDQEADAESVTYLLNELLMPEPFGQRRSPRILYGTPVRFSPDQKDAPMFDGFTFNVNIGGLYIRSTTPLPMQTLIEVSFTPPFGRGKVNMIAQVVWRKEYGKDESPTTPPGMGIQFVKSWIADKSGFEAGYKALLAVSENNKGSVTQ